MLYEAHLVDFDKGEQRTPEFLSLNPNGKIAAILDPNGPEGEPLPCSNPVPFCNISRRGQTDFCRPPRLAVTRLSSGCIFKWAGSDRCSARSASIRRSRI